MSLVTGSSSAGGAGRKWDNLQVIDIHVHAIPPQLRSEVRRGRFPRISVSEEDEFLFPEMAPSPPAPTALLDFNGLEASSKEIGVTTSLIGPWTDLLGYTLDRRDAQAWTRCYNTSLVESCSERQSMLPIATVPLQHPLLAVEAISEAGDLGCEGLMVGTDIPNRALGSSQLDIVWEAAVNAEMPVLIHPTFLKIPTQLKRRGLKNAVGRAGALAVALSEIVYSGVHIRHPGLKLIASHGGGSFLGLLPRIVRNTEIGWAESDIDIAAAVDWLHWDSVVLDPTVLRNLVTSVGVNRVLLGSDAPFPWEPDSVRTVFDARLDGSDTAAVLGETAAKLYGIVRRDT